MPSGLGESPGGWGSTPGGFGGGGGGGSSQDDGWSFGPGNVGDGGWGMGPGNFGDPGGAPPGWDGGGGWNFGVSPGSVPSSSWAGADYSFSPMAPLTSGFSSPSYGLQAPSVPSTPTWHGEIGLGIPKGPSAPSEAPGTSFMDSDFVKNLRRYGLMAARQNPTAGRALQVAGLADDIGSGNTGRALGSLAGTLTNNPLVGGLTGIGIDAITRPTNTYTDESGKVTVGPDGMPTMSPGDRIAQMGMRTIGGIAGGALLGPAGSMIGSDLMGRLGPSTGPAPDRGNYAGGGSTTAQGNQRDFVGPIVGGLMQLYGQNRANRSAREQQTANSQSQAQIQALMQQMQAGPTGVRMPGAPAVRQPNFAGIQRQLEGMFGPKSGVAAELRAQLERKDAAAGRRSQYGPREVQLMSELTRLRAQAEPSYMNAEVAAANAANQGAYNVYNSQMQGYQGQLQNHQQNLQRLLAAQQLGMTNTGQQAQLQQAADQRRQQQLAALYGMGRESGFFDWAGNTLRDLF